MVPSPYPYLFSCLEEEAALLCEALLGFSLPDLMTTARTVAGEGELWGEPAHVVLGQLIVQHRED